MDFGIFIMVWRGVLVQARQAYFSQGWKKPDFFPLENRFFGFNE
jgi:hypothetical protein